MLGVSYVHPVSVRGRTVFGGGGAAPFDGAALQPAFRWAARSFLPTQI